MELLWIILLIFLAAGVVLFLLMLCLWLVLRRHGKHEHLDVERGLVPEPYTPVFDRSSIITARDASSVSGIEQTQSCQKVGVRKSPAASSGNMLTYTRAAFRDAPAVPRSSWSTISTTTPTYPAYNSKAGAHNTLRVAPECRIENSGAASGAPTKYPYISTQGNFSGIPEQKPLIATPVDHRVSVQSSVRTKQRNYWDIKSPTAPSSVVKQDSPPSRKMKVSPKTRFGSFTGSTGSISKKIPVSTSTTGVLTSDWIDEVDSQLSASGRSTLPTTRLPISDRDIDVILPGAREQKKKKPKTLRPTLDLHGLRYRPARVEINKFLRQNRDMEVSIITGRGNHSLNNKSVMKPLLEDILRQKNLKYKTKNKGGAYLIEN